MIGSSLIIGSITFILYMKRGQNNICIKWVMFIHVYKSEIRCDGHGAT